MTRRSDKKSDPNEPLQDFLDWQKHRYDPGFWITEWVKKGRLDPEVLIYKRANFPSFWRTLLIYPFIATVLTGPIMYIHEEIPHATIIVIVANVIIFVGTWLLIHKWMVKAKDQDKKSITTK